MLLAGLIFFLNPELPFGTATFLRGAAVYGLLGGMGGLTGALVAFRGNAHRALRTLPWLLTASLGLAAVLAGAHASRFGFFLPPGINVRLIKAAVSMSIAALIAFYTALLHTVHRRPYGTRSKVGLALLALVALYATVERREAFRDRPGPSPRPSAVEANERPRLLVVGIDGASLDVLLPAAEQGHLPFLHEALRTGAYGRLSSLDPGRSRALWTSLATGKHPYKHGLVSQHVYPAPWLAAGGELEILPRWLGFRAWGLFGAGSRATDARDRGALAMWEILPRFGVPCGVVGWPASAPVSGETRFTVSDRFFTATGEGDEGEGGGGEGGGDRRGGGDEPGDRLRTADPPEVAERARLFRIAGDEVDPRLAARLGEDVPAAVLEALARDLWRESLTAFLLDQHRDLGAAFVQLGGLAEVSGLYFGGYTAARLEGVQDPAYLEAARRLEAYYAHLDQFLATLWERTPPPRLLAVVSAYGVEPPGALRRAWSELGREPLLAGSFHGEPDGVLILHGDGVQAGALLTGARLVDLTPTLLYGIGAPVARDLDGRVLTAAFDRNYLARRPLSFLPSYETLSRPDTIGGPTR